MPDQLNQGFDPNEDPIDREFRLMQQAKAHAMQQGLAPGEYSLSEMTATIGQAEKMKYDQQQQMNKATGANVLGTGAGMPTGVPEEPMSPMPGKEAPPFQSPTEDKPIGDLPEAKSYWDQIRQGVIDKASKTGDVMGAFKEEFERLPGTQRFDFGRTMRSAADDLGLKFIGREDPEGAPEFGFAMRLAENPYSKDYVPGKGYLYSRNYATGEREYIDKEIFDQEVIPWKDAKAQGREAEFIQQSEYPLESLDDPDRLHHRKQYLTAPRK